MTVEETRLSKQHARTFGQDLMRGEHVVGGGVGKSLNIKTQERVQGKIESGDIDGGMAAGQSGTSIFDPVLCELVYRWFCPPSGIVLDPFAGGSVRGIVAAKLGREYIGYELRKEQVDANRAQADRICDTVSPVWINDDSLNISVDIAADLVFSCPPYADLEVYSDDPKDLSTMPYEQFVETYSAIIRKACSQLKEDRFAVFVVGEVRAKSGAYYNFVGDTVKAFLDAGLSYYNEMILVTAVGSLPIRVGRQFESGRKIGKTHQNVLVFLKGNAKAAVQAIGKVEFAEPEDTVTVKISAKSARLEFVPCSPEFIADVCHGRCCDAPSRPDGCMVTINPNETEAIEALGGEVVDGLLKPKHGEKGCPFKSDGLCTLHSTDSKPFGCIGSPFTLNKNGTLIVRNRYKMLPCYKAENEKVPAYQAHKASLQEIFGEIEALRITEHLDNGGGDLDAWMPRDTFDMLKVNDDIKRNELHT